MLTLLVALLLEFVGSELLFRRAEDDRTSRAHAMRLVDHLVVAERLVVDLPPEVRDAELRRLWRDPLVVGWSPDSRLPDARSERGRLDEIKRTALASAPEWSGRGLRLASIGDSDKLRGALQLEDGSWLEFEETSDLHPPPTLARHAGPLLLLAVCIALLALVFTWMIGRPLRRLAEAADRVGQGDQSVIVPEEGPREVRQAAVAFNAMRGRLLQQVDERLQSLAAVSHDLRTPIARLRLRAPDIQPLEVRDGVEHDLGDMERFIASIMDFLRGTDAEAEAPIDLASLVKTIVDEAFDLGGDIRYVGPSRLEAVTRPVKLQRAILNLVQNALHQRAQVTVSLSSSNGVVIIQVEDEGPGIPPDQLEKVFQPFYRLDVSRSSGMGGAGLGLSIVRRSAERLGGGVALENRPGGGLRATLRLPARAP
ncbi:ATP-binding protein [Phenylobacterium sp.]|uniref:ATP-binding protein n=1 Tax=Phenylobacterium sp. TaxID=1871053 RepID=UPI0028976EAD|nr:ATP-binding protein [Phenylobacterium sp.]